MGISYRSCYFYPMPIGDIALPQCMADSTSLRVANLTAFVEMLVLPFIQYPISAAIKGWDKANFAVLATADKPLEEGSLAKGGKLNIIVSSEMSNS